SACLEPSLRRELRVDLRYSRAGDAQVHGQAPGGRQPLARRDPARDDRVPQGALKRAGGTGLPKLKGKVRLERLGMLHAAEPRGLAAHSLRGRTGQQRLVTPISFQALIETMRPRIAAVCGSPRTASASVTTGSGTWGSASRVTAPVGAAGRRPPAAYRGAASPTASTPPPSRPSPPHPAETQS